MCLHLGFCTNETCRLWAPPKASLSPDFVLPTTKLGHAAHGTERARLAHKISVLADGKSGEENTGKNQETPWQWIEDLLNRMNKDHEPVIDVDHDNFSGTFFLFCLSLSYFFVCFCFVLFCFVLFCFVLLNFLFITFRAFSRCSPPLIITPSAAARPVPTMTATKT